jgi:putative sterol carrier protein
MAAEIFTPEWAAQWADKINENSRYRAAAAKWEGAIGLVMTADAEMGIPTSRAVVADLWHGECRGASSGSINDLDEVPYLIQAVPEVWRSVLAGRTDPIVGLMGGKLKLARGGLFALLPYAKAAKELVVSASQVETSFPEGWD